MSLDKNVTDSKVALEHFTKVAREHVGSLQPLNLASPRELVERAGAAECLLRGLLEAMETIRILQSIKLANIPDDKFTQNYTEIFKKNPEEENEKWPVPGGLIKFPQQTTPLGNKVRTSEITETPDCPKYVTPDPLQPKRGPQVGELVVIRRSGNTPLCTYPPLYAKVDWVMPDGNIRVKLERNGELWVLLPDAVEVLK